MHTHTWNMHACPRVRRFIEQFGCIAGSVSYLPYVDEMESVRIVRTYMYLSCMSNLTTTTELLLHACFTVTFV